MSLRSGPDVRSREPRERGVYLPSADNKTAIVYLRQTSTPSIARKWTEGPRSFKRTGRLRSQGCVARHLRIFGPLVTALNEIGRMARSEAR